ncbi:MAG: lactate racemase domain-containing protein [Verrucomicrobia bacterium]|nr:lactate racemase domain-containing protein [Verrucomicrobiota bacterium]
MNVYRVDQKLVSHPLEDIEAEVFRQLDGLGLTPPRGRVAITAGSRGIDNIVRITKAAGDWLRANGAEPFLVPCMGSHNGATAEGQRQMVESLGLTESATGMEIRSSMDVVKVGTVSSGDVWMDRHCHEADGVLVLNRIKLHTCFSGPVQSGLTKMMVVGMGKIRSAETFHSAPTPAMKDMLLEMGSLIVGSGKIFCGLAILEDGYDRTAELHAIAPGEILAREPALLERHRHYFPALPCDDLRVLVVGEIGKTFSGSGMDTNVIGRRGISGYEDLDRPRIAVIAALGLSEASHGNAIGVGLADFITRRLREAIDEKKTFLNVYTTGEMRRMAIPCTLSDDEEVVERIRERYGDSGWMVVPNTLHLETLYCSEDIAEELRASSRCTVAGSPVPLEFREGRLTLFEPLISTNPHVSQSRCRGAL